MRVIDDRMPTSGREQYFSISESRLMFIYSIFIRNPCPYIQLDI
jgi:hypothetical protein